MFFIFREKKNTFIVLFLILLLGAGLRIVNLDKFDLWFDEVSTVLEAKDALSINFAQDNNPPLYMYLLHFWGRYFDSEYGLRLLSVIFGSMSIVMIFILARVLYTKRIALISAFILAVSPFHIYYSREARRYSMTVLLSLAAAYFFVKAFRKGQTRFWAGFVIFTILNIYCHYVDVLVWLAMLVFFFIIRKTLSKETKIKGWISNAFIFLSFTPWFLFLFKAIKNLEGIMSDYGMSFWGQPGSSRALLMTFKNFTIGYNAPVWVYLSATVFFFYFFIKGILVLRLKKEKELILGLLCLSMPVLVIFAVSLFKSLYIDRFFISSSVFYYFIAAAGLSSLKNKKLLMSLLLLLILSGLALKNYYNNIFPPVRETYAWEQRVKRDFRAMAGYINERFEEGDGIFHSCHNTMPSFAYYLNKLRNKEIIPENKHIRLAFLDKTNGLRFLEFNRYGQPAGRSYVKPFVEEKRFWFIFSAWDFKRSEMERLDSFALLGWLNKNYTVMEKKEFDNSIVFLYAQK